MQEIGSQSRAAPPRLRNAGSRGQDPAWETKKSGVAIPALAAALLFARRQKARRGKDSALRAEAPAGRL